MSGTVDSHESETASTLLNVTGNLLTVHVSNVIGSPFLNDGPTHIGNPVLGSQGGDSSIGITRVLENLVATNELRIDPVGSILEGSIVDGVAAEIPLGCLWLDV